MEEKNNSSIKKMIMKRIIFLSVFLCIAIGITAYFIIANPLERKETNEKQIAIENSQEPEEIAEEEKLARNHIPVLDINRDTFNYNSLKINQVKEEYLDFEIEYYQIDGLKDKTIENNVNNKLKQDLEDFIYENLQNGNIKKEKLVVYPYIYANFSNVISVAYSLNSYIYNEEMRRNEYSWYQILLENFNLLTGEKIKLQDLFTEDTLGSDIFDSKFYSSVISSYATTENLMDEFTGEVVVTDYNDIEDLMLELILNFNNRKDFDFYFDEQSITILNPYGKIFLEDCLDFVALYHNFKSDTNIFTGEFEAITNVPVLIKRYPSDYQVVEEGDNYYLDVNFLKDYRSDKDDEELKEIKERINDVVINYINDEVESLKQEASLSNAFTIYNYAYDVCTNATTINNYNENTGNWEREWIPNGTYRVSYHKAKMVTTKSLFQSEIKQRIINTFRDPDRVPRGDVRLYNNIFYNEMYDYSEEAYNQMNKDWEHISGAFYLDRAGNIFETEEEALESVIWGTGD